MSSPKRLAVMCTLLILLTGCEPKVREGTIIDKSHYPEVTTRKGDRDVITQRDHCTLTIRDYQKKVYEVEIPCADMDRYHKGDYWYRSSPPPTKGPS